MKYRLLADTGVFVSELCLGAMTFGGRGQLDEVSKDSSGNKCVIVGVEAPAWQGATNAHTGRM